ncbi:MAG TPA: hypothetical protein VLJ39_03875 [Tepidisphaeraceae bacterium]|jgi:hypothetical protein|nr:hypothetical protein [Tepidisphaeraceae bacterium]
MKHVAAPSPDGTPADTRTPFDKFRDLARHVLTTPKAEALEHERPKAKREKRKA